MRIGHWLVVLATFIAYFTHGGLLEIHRVAGYTVLVYVGVRLVWGFLGGTHARFGNFLPTPRAALGYFSALLRGREVRFIGHNPAGALMIVLMLAMLLTAALTGILLDTTQYRDFRPMHSVHSGISDGLVILAVLHVCGVLYASWRHRENLIAAMFTGAKRRGK